MYISIEQFKTYLFSKIFSFWHRSPHCDQDWHQQSKYWASPSPYTSFGKRGLCGQHPIYDPGPIRGKFLQRQWRYACGRPRYRWWSFVSGGYRVLWSSLCGQILHYQSTQQSSRLFVIFFLIQGRRKRGVLRGPIVPPIFGSYRVKTLLFQFPSLKLPLWPDLTLPFNTAMR